MSQASKDTQPRGFDAADHALNRADAITQCIEAAHAGGESALPPDAEVVATACRVVADEISLAREAMDVERNSRGNVVALKP